jgi:hypothetical protein
MSEPITISRRTLVRAAGAAVAGTGGVAALLTAGTGTTMAASFDTERAAAEAHDGRLYDVRLSPEVTLAWEGATTTLGKASIRIDATHEGSTSTLIERDDLSVPDEPDTSQTYTDLGTATVVEDGPYERADFRAPTDGETVETTIELTLTARLYDTNDEVVAETTAEPRVVVRVSNTEVTIEVTGTMDPAVVTDEPD